MAVINDDIFSCILSHIYDKTSLYNLLTALPITHPLFPPALLRLCQLPVYLTCTTPGTEDTPLILDWILGQDEGSGVSHFAVAAALKDLVIDFGLPPLVFHDPRFSVIALERRLVTLFSKTQNLRSLDWRNGSYPWGQHLTALGQLQFLETFRIDTNLSDTLWKDLGLEWSGSPQQGPTSSYVSAILGFQRFSNWNYNYSWTTLHTIRLFMVLPPDTFPALTKLEIRDEMWQEHLWITDDDAELSSNLGARGGRCYWGLVPSFLASVNLGHLSNLAHFFYSVEELWDQTGDEEVVKKKAEWVGVLKLILGRLETLRVGFGALDDTGVALVLGCCDRAKLTHFGFWWNWQAYGENEPATNPITLRDIGLIFQTIPSICRVGLGCNSVWERIPVLSDQSDQANQNMGFVCMHDAFSVSEKRLSNLSHDGIPEFYRGQPSELWDDHGVYIYDEEIAHGQEVKELRELLRRILPQHSINHSTT
ncbi:hypothetical protein BD779DRAFT_1735826 [Infundibulicybe gibba]|nr:hypothetical protein BD779DRAFT_1735826 [Infundibulicybe gibba]